MTQLLTPNFRTWCARQFVKSVVGRERSVLSESISRYVEYGYVDANYTDEFFVIIDNSGVSTADVGYFYVFAGDDFDYQSAIPTPTEAIEDYHYSTYDKMHFGKHATTSDVSYMINRHDWISDTVYSEYNSADPLLYDKNFYTVTQESGAYHVFKCIDNAGGSPSTHMPSVYEYNTSDGSILTSTTMISAANYYYKTSDDYVWMYMYSIPNQIFSKFATADYIPLTSEVTDLPPSIGSIESIEITDMGIYHNAYVSGTIKKINVNNDTNSLYLTTNGIDLFELTNMYEGSSIYITDGKGSGQIKTITYSGVDGTERFIQVDSPFAVSLDATSKFEIGPRVSIDGDGSGAVARAVVENGLVTQIDMISSGSGYSYANVSIVTNTGYYSSEGVFVSTDTAATAQAIISPPRGHGRDLINELYADKVCVSVDFVGNNHPISNYSQYGLIVDPIFKSVELVVDSSAGFQTGEVILQQDNASYGVISAIDDTNNTISVKNARGVFTSGSQLYGIGSNTYATSTGVSVDTSSFEMADIIDNSGEILLIKNDVYVERADGQTERVKIVIDF